jgi:hypothetical protein
MGVLGRRLGQITARASAPMVLLMVPAGDEAGHERADSRTGFEDGAEPRPPPGMVRFRARSAHVSSFGSLVTRPELREPRRVSSGVAGRACRSGGSCAVVRDQSCRVLSTIGPEREPVAISALL